LQTKGPTRSRALRIPLKVLEYSSKYIKEEEGFNKVQKEKLFKRDI
jgi:hypothetical protein